MDTIKKLVGELVSVAAITPQVGLQMLQLMSDYYENICPDRFWRDLSEKDWVLLLRDGDGTIHGFTTIKLYQFTVAGIAVKLVYSGDTIVRHEYWGHRELHRSWIRNVYSLIGAESEKTYWLLISKGYKTYRFLPVYFYRFYPCYNMDTPQFEDQIINQFGQEKYPVHYDCNRGVIRLNGTRDYLKSGVADITEERLKDPHIRFFVAQNPGYLHGDELVCLTELCPANIKPIGWRYLKKSEIR